MKRTLILLLAIASLGGGAWWIVRADRLPENKPISLTDGSVLHFRGVTYGTNHYYQTGGLLGRLAQMIPGRWAARFRGGARVNNSTPCVTVWVERRGPGGPRAATQYTLGTGTSFSPTRTAHSVSSGLPGGSMIEGLGFSSFPRRGKSVTLRFHDRGVNWGAPQFAGEFTFNNPAFSKAAGWQAEPLPTVKQVEDFEVTLKEAFVGVDRSRSSDIRIGTKDVETGAYARLHFSREGSLYTEWGAPSIEMSDATGNKTTSSSWTGSAKGDDYVTIFQPFLWPDESAWKMRFELSRLTNFSAAESWTVRGIPLGATNLADDAAFRTNLQGVAIEIASLRSRPMSGVTHELHVRYQPGQPDYRLTMVEARDDYGGTVERNGSSWSAGSYTFQIRAHTNAVTLDVTMALHQSRYVEFLVAPKVIDEAAAKKERELDR